MESRGGGCYQTEWLLPTHTKSIFVDFQHVQDGKCLHAPEGWIVASILRRRGRGMGGGGIEKIPVFHPPDFCYHLLDKEGLPRASFAVRPRIKPHPPGKILPLPLHSFCSRVAEPVGSGPDQYSGGSIVCRFTLLHYF